MRKITVASDSFKGSLTSMQVADNVERAVKEVFPDCHVQKIDVADGGEGTVEALVSSLGGEYVDVEVAGPIGRKVTARYGIIDEGRTAVIEMAVASGLPLISPEERNPLKTSTYGTGMMIRDALNRGCRKFLVGIGGSATNDGGTGMLSALGFMFLDKDGYVLEGTGENLARIASVCDADVLREVSEAEFTVACDVDNPFCGPAGAAYVFAPQKGADDAMVRCLDEGLASFAGVISRYTGQMVADLPGAGAAGGLGGAFKAFLGARLTRGIEIVLDAIGFDGKIAGSSLVITGEGSVDAQTLMGKTPSGVLARASKLGIPVMVLGGKVDASVDFLKAGFSAVCQVTPEDMSLEDAMKADIAGENIFNAVIRLLGAE
ncbi:MAG: glycerate kinase [Bacteroidales bacterium]|nr:glycerate kinase [Bacteroidales bacterium]